jgi:hypothetical protein
MHRQFEFSVDSFQITLDSLIDNLNGEKHPVIRLRACMGTFFFNFPPFVSSKIQPSVMPMSFITNTNSEI